MNDLFRRLLARLQRPRWLAPLRERWQQWRAGPPPAAAATPAPAALPMARYASVVIPALNEARHIASVVAYALADEATAEVVVIDDSSIDDTARLAREAGARVVTSSMLGKGASMRDGVATARHELVVYLDGDLSGLRPGIVSSLCRPLVRGEADFVKARFGRGGGRVTELTAKPMLKVFFPELAHFAQPLGGIVAARRSLLRTLEFEDAYGVDVGLLIDAHRTGARLAEVDIGSLEHDSQPLLDLTLMANEVARVIHARARTAGRLHVEQINAMYESQRQAAASLDYVLTRRRGRSRLLLLTLDGVLTRDDFMRALARATGQEAALDDALAHPGNDEVARAERIARLFRFVHRTQFERVAHGLVLQPGTIEFVNRMRRAGFMVGVLADSYFVAADIVRRRVFADFALAHTMQFESDVCTGDLHLSPAFMPGRAGETPAPCMSHVLQRFRADTAAPVVAECWAVGAHDSHEALLRAADRAFRVDPQAAASDGATSVTMVSSCEDLLAFVPDSQADQRAAA